MSLGNWGGSEGGGPRVPGGTGSDVFKSLMSGRDELSEGPEGNYVVRRVKVGAFQRDTSVASGNQSITGVGFKPYAIVAFSEEEGGTAASWGMDDGTTAQCIQTSTLVAWTQTDFLIANNDGAGATYNGKVGSFDLDGFTIAWTKGGSPTGTIDIKYIAFGRG